MACGREAVARGLTLPSSRVRLLNDLEAMAYSVPVLRDDEVHVLQAGDGPSKARQRRQR